MLQVAYSPVDVGIVDNKQYFAAVTIRGRSLMVRLAADPTQTGRRRRRHLPAERRMGGYRRRAALLMTVAICCRPAGRARSRQVILQVAGAKSSTEEVNPRRDVVAKA